MRCRKRSSVASFLFLLCFSHELPGHSSSRRREGNQLENPATALGRLCNEVQRRDCRRQTSPLSSGCAPRKAAYSPMLFWSVGDCFNCLLRLQSAKLHGSLSSVNLVRLPTFAFRSRPVH